MKKEEKRGKRSFDKLNSLHKFNEAQKLPPYFSLTADLIPQDT